MIINISVTDKRPTVVGAPVIVCDNSDYNIQFTFDSEWDAYAAKTARFVYVREGAVKFQDIPFTGDTVGVPKLSRVRFVRVGVFAGDLKTTTPATIPCVLSIRCKSGETDQEVLTPSQYDEIMAILGAGGITDEQLAAALEDYLAANPIETGATAEQAAQIQANKEAIEELQLAGAGTDATLSESGKPADAKAVGDALAQVSVRQDIFPETYLTEDGDIGEWASMDNYLLFRIPEPLVVGDIYFVTVDGVEETVVAQEYADEVYSGVAIHFNGGFIVYSEVLEAATAYNALYFPEEITEDASGNTHLIPITLGIAKPAKDLPSALPNPHALTITGAVSATYDGSAPVSVEIPSGGATEMQPLTLTGAVSATYDGSEAVSVEIPQGGGGGTTEPMRLIHSVDFTSGEALPGSITITTDTEGNPFELQRIMIVVSNVTSDNYISVTFPQDQWNALLKVWPKVTNGSYTIEIERLANKIFRSYCITGETTIAQWKVKTTGPNIASITGIKVSPHETAGDGANISIYGC